MSPRTSSITLVAWKDGLEHKGQMSNDNSDLGPT